jgi:hypothetical protein
MALSKLENIADVHKQISTKTAGTPSQICDTTESLNSKLTANMITNNYELLQYQLSPVPNTYSNVLKTALQNPIKVHEALRRAEVRTRQILLSPKEDHPLYSKSDTNESVAQKLQQAIVYRHHKVGRGPSSRSQVSPPST